MITRTFVSSVTLLLIASAPVFGQYAARQPEPVTPAGSDTPQLAAGPTSSADLYAGLTHIYRLTDDASFAEGCFDFCDCPVWLTEDFRGTMRVDMMPSASVAFEYYSVSEVNWLVVAGEGMFRMTGEGTYRTGVVSGQRMQQLTLDLKRAEDAEVEHFDSGLVPGGTGGPYPAIDIEINKNGLYCFDTLIGVSARPVPRRQLRPYTLTENSSHQEGCLPPCLCPILLDGGVRGTFDLVRIYQLGDVTEHAVVNVDWRILPFNPGTSDGTRVSGFGIYRAQTPTISPTPVEPNHEMLIDLNVGGEWDFYESGWVPNTNRPNITIAVAKNGFFCYDEVFDIDARPGH